MEETLFTKSCFVFFVFFLSSMHFNFIVTITTTTTITADAPQHFLQLRQGHFGRGINLLGETLHEQFNVQLHLLYQTSILLKARRAGDCLRQPKKTEYDKKKNKFYVQTDQKTVHKKR